MTTRRSAISRISSRSLLTSSTAAPRLRAATISAWICATAEKWSPKHGFAAMITSAPPASSRASTARCTLPPDNAESGVCGERVRIS
jgi:hypothetical protein